MSDHAIVPAMTDAQRAIDLVKGLMGIVTTLRHDLFQDGVDYGAITHTAPLVRCRNRYGEIVYLSPEMAMNAAANGAVTLLSETEGKPE